MATELVVVPPPLGDLRRPALSRGLLLVMRPAEGSKVGLSMVITSNNVIHVGRVFRATFTCVGVQVSAAKCIAPQDALTYATPVSRETTPSIRTGPLRHSAITARDVVTRTPRPCLRVERYGPEAAFIVLGRMDDRFQGGLRPLCLLFMDSRPLASRTFRR